MKKIVFLLIFIAVGGGAYAYFFHRTDRPVDQLTLYGNIDIRQVQLSFHDPEHIDEMKVKEGDEVKKGQLLAIQELSRFTYRLQAAKAKLEAQKNVVAKLEAGYRKEDIAKAKAEVQAEQARLRFSQMELNRQKALSNKALASQEAVDRAKANLDQAKARLAALKAQLQRLKQGPRKEDIAQARAILEVEKAAVALAQQQWDDAHLRAPASGVIRDRILEPGDMADARTPVYTLALMNPLWVRTYIPEQELGKIHPGQRATIITDSYPGQAYSGWVGYISPTAEFTPKSIETPELRTSLVYQMRVFVCNHHNELRLGMPVTVTIRLKDADVTPTMSCHSS